MNRKRRRLTRGKIVKSNNGVLNINSLPEEMLINIFSYLSHNELGKIARVCRSWNELTRCPLLWKEVKVELNKFDNNSENAVTRFFIEVLPPCVTRIKLNFRFSPLNFEELCARLKERCPHLEQLFLYEAKLSDSLLSVVNVCTQLLQNVKSLIFCHCEFPEYSQNSKFDGFYKIEVLGLCWCYLGQYDKLPFSKMPHLKNLYVHDRNISSSWFDGDISFLSQLYVLNLGYTRIDTRTLQAVMNHGHILQELYLCDTDVKTEYLKFDDFVFPHLKTICVRNCCDTTCMGLVFLIDSCQSLENVYVAEGMAASYADHPFIVANKRKLEIVKAVISCDDHQAVHYKGYSYRMGNRCLV